MVTENVGTVLKDYKVGKVFIQFYSHPTCTSSLMLIPFTVEEVLIVVAL